MVYVNKRVWHIPLLFVQWKTPDDGQRNCTKYVEFYSKNKFEKSVHLVGFIIRIYYDARSLERQNSIMHVTFVPYASDKLPPILIKAVLVDVQLKGAQKNTVV